MAADVYTTESIRDLLMRSDLACMRGVLAVFRKQTEYEKNCRATVNKNGVGFCANHARAGSNLALWMSRGNFDGVFRRRVGGTTMYGGDEISRVVLCRMLALRYTEQLADEANRSEREREVAMVTAYEDEEYGRRERESSRYERDDYGIYHTWPC
jgi:hypothetical protein|tara:strand:- start:180 stop:644 length:465 start_codon:yes stop_codon:yes gene_type:complete